MVNKTNTAAAFVVVNGKQIDVAVKGLTLDAICQEMIEATEKQYGSHIRIAAKLNELLPFAWYDVDPQEVSDEAKALDVHKKPLYAALKKAGHTNPSVPFGRMREYGRNLRAGLSPNGKTMADGSAIPNSVSTEGEGEGANPAKRSPVLRNIDELVKLWKANDKLGKDAPAKVTAAQPHIEAALKALGVDVRTVK